MLLQRPYDEGLDKRRNQKKTKQNMMCLPRRGHERNKVVWSKSVCGSVFSSNHTTSSSPKSRSEP